MTRIINQEKKKPDWKKPEDYNVLNNIGLDQWAWEFLKRNQKYIELWDKFSKDLTEEQKLVPDWYYLTMYKGAFNPTLCDATYWGLRHGYLNPDPRIEHSSISFIPLGGENHVELFSGTQEGTLVYGLPDYETGNVIFEFNFNQPIIPQIETAKKELLKLQTESKEKGNKVRKAFKPRRDEWILLLRILDALAAKTKTKDIIDTLFPKDRLNVNVDRNKLFYDKKKQARRYVNHDYRFIPFSEE